MSLNETEKHKHTQLIQVWDIGAQKVEVDLSIQTDTPLQFDFICPWNYWRQNHILSLSNKTMTQNGFRSE